MKGGVAIIALLLSVALLASIPLKVHAAAPTNIQIAASATAGTGTIPSYGTQVGFKDTIFADSVSETGTYINFINAAYSTSTTTTQTFGIAVSAACTSPEADINAIASDHIEFIITSTAGNCLVYHNYTMPSSLTGPPQSTVVTYASSAVTIQQSSYFTSATSFASCQVPCVYQNTANTTLILKLNNVSPQTIDFYYPVFGGSAGGGGNQGGGPITPPSGGGGGGGQIIIPPTIQNITKTIQQNPQTFSTAVLVVIAVITIAIFLGITQEKGGFRKPRSSKANVRSPSHKEARWRKPK